MVAQNDPFSRLMAEISSLAGQDFEPDNNGVVTLLIDDVMISLEGPAESRFIYFHAPIRRLSGDRLADLEAAMRLNLFRHDVSGTWLALDQSSDELLLCYTVQIDQIRADNIVATIEALAASVRALRSADREHTDEFDPPAADLQNFLRI